MASPRRCRTTSLDAFRGARVPRTLLMIMALLLGSARGQQQCEDTCIDSWGFSNWMSANNGLCQDGGPGSESSWCDLGTDCTDCIGPDGSNRWQPASHHPLAL